MLKSLWLSSFLVMSVFYQYAFAGNNKPDTSDASSLANKPFCKIAAVEPLKTINSYPQQNAQLIKKKEIIEEQKEDISSFYISIGAKSKNTIESIEKLLSISIEQALKDFSKKEKNPISDIKEITILPFSKEKHKELNNCFRAIVENFLSSANADDFEVRLQSLHDNLQPLIKKMDDQILAFCNITNKGSESIKEYTHSSLETYKEEKKKLTSRSSDMIVHFIKAREYIIKTKERINENKKIIEASYTDIKNPQIQNTAEQTRKKAEMTINFLKDSVLKTEAALHMLYPYQRDSLSDGFKSLGSKIGIYYKDSEATRLEITGEKSLKESYKISLSLDDHKDIHSSLTKDFNEFILTLLFTPSIAVEDALKENRFIIEKKKLEEKSTESEK